MKHTIPLAIATLLALSSCQTQQTPVDQNLIQLSANIPSVIIHSTSSKAPIGSNPGETATFKATVLGWEVANGGNINYSTTPTWIASTNDIAAVEKTDILLDPLKSYKSAHTTYMCAIYPATDAANFATGIATFTGNATDGTQDVLVAAPISGSTSDKTGKQLLFKHPLTQVKFMVQALGGLAPTNVTSITVKNAELPTGINITTNEPIYAAAANLAIPGISNPAVTNTATIVGQPVMIKPIASNKITLLVVTSTNTTGYNIDAKINNDATFIPGRAYTITLKFLAGDVINAEASVTEWEEEVGSGEID